MIFEGVCIGGPREGEMIKCSKPVYEVVEFPEFTFSTYAPSTDPAGPIHKIHQYRFKTIIHLGGFWVHESLPDNTYLAYLQHRFAELAHKVKHGDANRSDR